MAHKGYIHPPGTPRVMQREFVFPGTKDPQGLKRTFKSPTYGKRTRGTGRDAGLQMGLRNWRLAQKRKKSILV